MAENLRALEYYRTSLDEIAKTMGFSSRAGDGKEFFNTMPNENWQSNASDQDVKSFLTAVDQVFIGELNRSRILKFVSDPDWSGMRSTTGEVGKKLGRPTDWQESAILKTGGLVAAASAGRINLIRAIEYAGFGVGLTELAHSAPTVGSSGSGSIIGENVIFYGAPGTGKSDRVNKKVKAAGKAPHRTVFHSDLQNSDFFGCLKPKMNGLNVEYGFSPGIFMTALSDAYLTPDEPVFLVIEELNRAAAAAVFGDLFLLLDRDEAGRGEYDVSFPSEESNQWFNNATHQSHKSIRLPSNLFIYATMNSADQGVYPIDTAFRRRWRQEYIPLDYNSGPDGEIAYVDATEKRHLVDWRKFVRLLNDHLTRSHTLAIAEDRLLGQWFVKKTELQGGKIPEKVLLYLWDDLLRHEGRNLLFDADNIKTYGKLTLAAEANGRFLSDSFLALLNDVSRIELDKPNEIDGNVS